MNLSIEARDYSDPDVVKLVAALQTEYVLRYGGPDETEIDPAEFRPPEGLFLVGLLDGTPIASAGWRRHGDGIVEIKRMYVAETARRRGLARRMLAEAERTAAAAGYVRAVLVTGLAQPEAMALYEVDGYTPADPFGIYADGPSARFYGKALRSAK